MQPEGNAICSILPPQILRRLADKPEMRDRPLRDLETTERLRGIRQTFAMPLLVIKPGTKRRTIFDANKTTNLPGTQVLDEGAPDHNVIAGENFHWRRLQYAEKQDQDDPTWGFSDFAGIAVTRSGLWRFLVSLIPEGLRPSVNAASHLVVQNIAAL